jgi:hypothetical protein
MPNHRFATQSRPAARPAKANTTKNTIRPVGVPVAAPRWLVALPVGEGGGEGVVDVTPRGDGFVSTLVIKTTTPWYTPWFET